MKDFRVRLLFRLRWFHAARFSWLIGLVLVLLPVICLLGFPTLLANLFVLDGPVQLFNVSWITLITAAMVLVTYRVTELNAPDRFDDYRHALRQYLVVRHISRDEFESRRRHWRFRWLLLAIMWAPIPLTAAVCTWMDPEPLWDRVANTVPYDWRVACIGGIAVAAGAVVGVVLLRLAAFIERNLLAPNAVAKGLLPFPGEALRLRSHGLEERRGSNASRFVAELFAKLGPGYSVHLPSVFSKRVQGDSQVALGHTQLALFSGLIVTFYFGNYLLGWGFDVIPDESSLFAALFFLLLTLLVFVCIVPGLAFFLDRYRIPVVVVALVNTCGLYMICETDHFFALNPRTVESQQRVDPYDPPAITEIYNNWKLPQGVGGKRTLVVIDASGGGIQASAWTAQVLTGLDEIYGAEFSRSVGLISAVSGGSVGTMYYLINRPEFWDPSQIQRRPLLRADVAERIRVMSQASALEATAWGIAYPDLLRAVFPPLTSRTVDRGWSVEQAWRNRMTLGGVGARNVSDVRLSDLGALSRKNQLPVVAFNATLVESGQRLVMSPIQSRPEDHHTVSTDSQEFFSLYGPTAHLRVSTAVRLSATFPYVSPVCRPLPGTSDGGREDRGYSLHVADGAYSDNEGVVTSVDWIDRLLEYYKDRDRILKRPFDRVLLIRIQPFPTSYMEDEATRSAGWVNALFGPLVAIMRVRVASQMERGNLELRLLSKAAEAESAVMSQKYSASESAAANEMETIKKRADRPAARSDRSEDSSDPNSVAHELFAVGERMKDARRRRERFEEIRVQTVRFEFQPPDGRAAPLSWKLTARQKQAIAEAWKDIANEENRDNPLEILDNYFERLDRDGSHYDR